MHVQKYKLTLEKQYKFYKWQITVTFIYLFIFRKHISNYSTDEKSSAIPSGIQDISQKKYKIIQVPNKNSPTALLEESYLLNICQLLLLGLTHYTPYIRHHCSHYDILVCDFNIWFTFLQIYTGSQHKCQHSANIWKYSPGHQQTFVLNTTKASISHYTAV
jgi:hypothetical protein